MATFDDVPRLKCRPHPPHDFVLYATESAKGTFVILLVS